MSEVKDLTPVVPATSITAQESVLKSAIQGIGTIVELRPGTVALVQNGLQVQKLIDKIAPDLEVASTLTIDSADMLAEAEAIAGRLAAVCADSGGIETERKALGAPFLDLQKTINDGYNAPRTHLAGVLNGLKTKMLDYTNEQARLAAEREAEERAKREAAALAASEAEAKATAEALDLMDKAKEAMDSGSEIAASALMQQAQAKADESRQAADVAVAAMYTRSTVAPAATAKGVRGKWKGVVTDKAKLIQHIAEQLTKGDLSLLNLLDVNESNLNKLADMQKQSLALPGTRPDYTQSLSVRKAAVPA